MSARKLRALLLGLLSLLAAALMPAATAHADGIDRNNDTANYSGGARLQRVEWFGNILPLPLSHCTTGFGVHRKGDNKRYLLTAGHCGQVGSNWTTAGNVLAKIGTIAERGTDRDVALIEAPSSAQIYDGGTGADTFKKTVVGTAKVTKGDSVCLSGSTTGTHCGLTVVGSGRYLNWGWQIQLRGPKGVVVANPGDSGGPVFKLTSNPDNVLAVGTITGGTDDEKKNGRLDSDGYQYVWIASIAGALNAFNIEVNTPSTPAPTTATPAPVPDPVHHALGTVTPPPSSPGSPAMAQTYYTQRLQDGFLVKSKDRPNGPEAESIIGNGTSVNVVCETNGPAVDGYPYTVWDRLDDGTWVYGYYLTTPGDGFTPALKHC
ncbi:S1 family peptidase [Kitasatospora sp. NPDC101235]|uniref:S1 family peptidase n=1 Tax=Kitasatospora sp. NPDC101235 TaxID=3364101 RepID=UPI00382470D1